MTNSFLKLNNGLPTISPVDVAYSPAFETFSGPTVSVRDGGLSPSVFTTFTNSPTLSMTPSVSGIYKVFASAPIYMSTAADYATSRIFNTSANATVIKENQGVTYNSAGGNVSSTYIQTTYQLVAGITYTFDIQVLVNSGTVYLAADLASFNIEADGIGGVLTGSNSYESTPITTDATMTGSGTFVTWANSPSFTVVPVVSGKYRIYSSPFIYSSSAGVYGLAKIINTSANATLITTSGGTVYGNTGDHGSSLFIQSEYYLIAGQTYIFDIQGATDGTSATIAMYGSVNPFSMFAELSSTLIGAGAPAQVVSNSSGGFSTTNGSSTPVTNLSATIISAGILPVDLWLQNDGLGGASTVGVTAATGSFANCQYYFYRNGTLLGVEQSELATTPAGSYLYIPSSSIRFTDLHPPAGTNVYTISVANGGGTNVIVSNAVLVAREAAAPQQGGESITAPVPTSFSASLNTGTGFSANSNIIFDTLDFNNNSPFNIATGNFTAPFDGVFQFNFNGSFSAGNVDVFLVTNNGASTKVIAQGITSATVTGSRVLELNQGDTVSIWMDTTNTANAGCNFSGSVYAGSISTNRTKIYLAGTNGIDVTTGTVMCFASVVESTGTDATYTPDTTLGDSFLINTEGMYAIDWRTTAGTLLGSNPQTFNLTKNTTTVNGTGTSDPNVLDVNNVDYAGGNYATVKLAVQDYFVPGDVIRVLVSGGNGYSDFSSNQGTAFRIVRII